MGKRIRFVVKFKKSGHAQCSKTYIATARTPEQAAAKVRGGHVISVTKYHP